MVLVVKGNYHFWKWERWCFHLGCRSRTSHKTKKRWRISCCCHAEPPKSGLWWKTFFLLHPFFVINDAINLLFEKTEMEVGFWSCKWSGNRKWQSGSKARWSRKTSPQALIAWIIQTNTLLNRVFPAPDAVKDAKTKEVTEVMWDALSTGYLLVAYRIG